MKPVELIITLVNEEGVVTSKLFHGVESRRNLYVKEVFGKEYYKVRKEITKNGKSEWNTHFTTVFEKCEIRVVQSLYETYESILLPIEGDEAQVKEEINKVHRIFYQSLRIGK